MNRGPGNVPVMKKESIEISNQITDICDFYHPTGILLWYATFPNENFCYNSECKEGCLSKFGEFDVEKRCDVLTEFLLRIIKPVKIKYPDIIMSLKIDVEGQGNIEYQYGVNLKDIKSKCELDETMYSYSQRR